MRLTPAIAVAALLCIAPASAQMTQAPTAPQNQPSGAMMMCGMQGTTGQAMPEAQDKTDKPMQMSMMCPCCQNMMKGKGMMQKMQKMPGME
jgi:hypothetical protein